MDPRYEETYASLYSAGPDYGPFFWPGFRFRPAYEGDRVKSAIDKADVRLRRNGEPGLRSDAKVMLLLNLVFMVEIPLAEHGDEAYRRYGRVDLESDVSVLVNAAAARSGKESVSAHAIVDALANNWSNLKLAETRLWGATPEYQ